MKLLLIVLVGVAVSSAFVVTSEKDVLASIKARQITREAELLTGKRLADYVNEHQTFFKASESRFTESQMQSRLMSEEYLAPLTERAPEIETISLADIPDSFDARQQWTQCPSLNNIRDQSDCGSCWAFAAAEAITDRTCIASNGNVKVTISAEDILSCCGLSCGLGCKGGFNIEAWKFWVSDGVCTGGSYESKAGCKPYAFAPCGHHVNETYFGPCPTKDYGTPKCTHSCVDGYTTSYKSDKHFGKSAYGVATSVSAIQKEIMTYGPVEAAYMVYEDFYQYKSGVYVHTAGKALGGHAVKILGWGTDQKTPYWLVANSWNTDWGENGYFRIIRGVDECGIEQAVVAGIPKV